MRVRLLLCLIVMFVVALPVAAQDAEGDDETVVIQPFERGVVFDTLTGELLEPLGPGTHAVVPVLQDVTIYDVSQQEYTMAGDDAVVARSSDGQEIRFDVTVIYGVNPQDVNLIHVNWQERYRESFIRPTLRALVRQEASLFTAEMIYGEDRIQLEFSIEEQATALLEEQGLSLTDLLIRDVTFSDDFSAALEARAVAEQRLQSTEIDAATRREEAAGMAEGFIEEARGAAQARIIQAEGLAEELRIVSPLLMENPLLIQYLFVSNLADNVTTLVVPGGGMFNLDLTNTDALMPMFQPPEDESP